MGKDWDGEFRQKGKGVDCSMGVNVGAVLMLENVLIQGMGRGIPGNKFSKQVQSPDSQGGQGP